MTDFLNIYDLNRQKSAVLQNAFEIQETQELNKIYTLDFKIPADDVKVQFLQPFHYARYGDTGQLYRIIKAELEDSDTPILSVNCEHVIATLVDDLMFGVVNLGGGKVKTADVITELLKKQKTKNWVLGECDFDRRFEYNWEQENILNALFSIPKEFTQAYKWLYDTTSYPWRLSLKAIDATIHPEYYIRAKRNLLSSGTTQDYAGICTRIYPLGYGEGINQLSIKDADIDKDTVIRKNGVAVNGNVAQTNTVKYNNTYIQASDEIVAQYGIKEKVLVDRRFEDANSLFSYGKTMLEGLQTPSMSRSFDVVDLYPLTSQDIDRAEVGKICKMTGDGTIAYITRTVRVLDDPGNLQIGLSTKATDVVSAIADLADRIRIETVYAQGATQLYQHSKDSNATTEKGMVMSLYFPEEMRQINKVLLRLKLGKFRSYSQATENDGQTTMTSENGGQTTMTSENGGQTTMTSENGGQTTMTSENGGQSGTTSTSGGGTINVSLTGKAVETDDPKWTGSDLAIRTMSVNLSDRSNYNTELYAVENTVGGLYVDVAHGHSISGSVETIQPDGSDHIHGHAAGSLYAEDWRADGRTVYGNSGHGHSIEDKTGHSHGIEKNKLKHWHTVNINVQSNVQGQSGFAHSHTFSVPNHKHNINLPNHKHNINLPNHKHNINLPNHKHTINLPNHKHNITPGIFESGNPTSFGIYVGGKLKTTINSTSYNDDISTWLVNNDNKIPRNTWIDVEIRPDDLAYVQSSVFIQGFVQSRGGGNY